MTRYFFFTDGHRDAQYHCGCPYLRAEPDGKLLLVWPVDSREVAWGQLPPDGVSLSYWHGGKLAEISAEAIAAQNTPERLRRRVLMAA